MCSGEGPKPKGEATYDEKKYKVNCTIKEGIYSEQMLAQAIRKSLRGQAKCVLLSIGDKGTVNEIMDRLEGVLGSVVSGQSVLQKFYITGQKADKAVAGSAWRRFCRKPSVKNRSEKKRITNIFRIKFGDPLDANG